MGSISVASWVARVAFVVLIAIGLWSRELRRAAAITFIALGLATWILLPRLVNNGGWFVTPVLAILDIALVLAIFKRDIRIG